MIELFTDIHDQKQCYVCKEFFLFSYLAANRIRNNVVYARCFVIELFSGEQD